MIKSSLRISILFISLLSLQLHAQCKIAELTSSTRTKIVKPYLYDGFNYVSFEFTQINQTLKKEFVAFKGQEYMLVFATSGFEERVEVTIFDTKKNQAVTTFVLGEGTNSFSFTPLKTGSYSIVYALAPSNTDVDHEECIAMLIGFADK